MNNNNFPVLSGSLADYQIIEILGSGGMGCVYKVYNQQMDKIFALKILLSHVKNPDTIKRFAREAKIMAKLNHPNIVKIYNTGVYQDNHYIIMDFVAGISLKQHLKNTSHSIRKLSQIMVKIGDAVQYAHDYEIIHRDLKPANIMISKNLEPYVLDFGIAKLVNNEISLSKTGNIIGTPAYMSPEQAMGKKVNYLTDVYSLGAIFYEMLSKTSLIKGKTPTNILYQVIHNEPVSLRKLNDRLSINLETICHKTIEKDTNKRYQSVAEFVVDINKFLGGEAIKTKPESKWKRRYKKIKKNKSIIIAATIGVLLVFLGPFFISQYQNKKQWRQINRYWKKAYNNISKAKKSKKNKIELYIKANNFFERALELAPDNAKIKKSLIKTKKKVGKLAIKQKNYLLSYTVFKQCKKLGDPEVYTLLKLLESEQKKLKQKHMDFIENAMKHISKSTPSKEVINWYMFQIVKMNKLLVIKKLVAYLQSNNKSQRMLAIRTLGRLKDTYTKVNKKDSVVWLLELLKKFNNRNIRKNEEEIEEIIWALGWLKDRRANEPVQTVRWYAGENSLLWNRTKTPYLWIPTNNVFAKNVEEYNTRGLIKIEKKDYIGAIKDYNKAIKINPKFSKAYNNRGNAYLALEKYTKAISDYNQAIELNPKYAKAYNNRGNAYYDQQDYIRALRDYTKATEIYPKFSIAYNGRGNAQKSLRNYSKALLNYSKAIKFYPRYIEAHYNRGIVYKIQKNYTKAIISFTNVIKLNPRDAQSYYLRGIVRKNQRKYRKAIIDFTSAIKCNPRFYKAYCDRGSVHKTQKHYANAIVDYSTTIKLVPKFAEAYFLRGTVYKIQKQHSKAIANFTMAIKYNPKFVDAYNLRGNTRKLLKEYNKAIEDYTQAIKLAPGFTAAYYNRGLVCKIQKKYKKAIVNFITAIKLDSRYSKAYYSIADIYYQMKQYQKALHYFQAFLKLAPYDSKAPKVRRLLRELKNSY